MQCGMWSGFSSKYDKATVQRKAPTSGGVYLLWVKYKDGKWGCFYAGKATNLRKRLLEHLSDNEEDECIMNNVGNYVCGFEFANVLTEKSRKGIERFLIDTYSPECNNVIPDAEPTKINLPD